MQNISKKEKYNSPYFFRGHEDDNSLRQISMETIPSIVILLRGLHKKSKNVNAKKPGQHYLANKCFHLQQGTFTVIVCIIDNSAMSRNLLHLEDATMSRIQKVTNVNDPLTQTHTQ